MTLKTFYIIWDLVWTNLFCWINLVSQVSTLSCSKLKKANRAFILRTLKLSFRRFTKICFWLYIKKSSQGLILREICTTAPRIQYSKALVQNIQVWDFHCRLPSSDVQKSWASTVVFLYTPCSVEPHLYFSYRALHLLSHLVSERTQSTVFFS